MYRYILWFWPLASVCPLVTGYDIVTDIATICTILGTDHSAVLCSLYGVYYARAISQYHIRNFIVYIDPDIALCLITESADPRRPHYYLEYYNSASTVMHCTLYTSAVCGVRTALAGIRPHNWPLTLNEILGPCSSCSE